MKLLKNSLRTYSEVCRYPCDQWGWNAFPRHLNLSKKIEIACCISQKNFLNKSTSRWRFDQFELHPELADRSTFRFDQTDDGHRMTFQEFQKLAIQTIQSTRIWKIQTNQLISMDAHIEKRITFLQFVDFDGGRKQQADGRVYRGQRGSAMRNRQHQHTHSTLSHSL